MLEVVDVSKEKIKIAGNIYDVDVPSVEQVQQLNKTLKAVDTDNSVDTFDALISFLNELGIPDEVVKKLKLRQLQMITEHLSGSKKN